MAFDAHKNLAVATVATAPSPATTGISLTVAAGEGARFPATPFTATVWPPTAIGTPVNAEIVRVTAVAADTFAVTRAQEGTVARAIVPGDVIAATVTAKTLTDIESGVNFPQLATAGNLLLTGPGTHLIAPDTVDGADTGSLYMCGGGSQPGARGASLRLYGNEHANAGLLQLVPGDPSGIDFWSGSLLRGRVHPSGGFSWGNTTDPGAGNLSVTGHLICGTPTAVGQIKAATNDGADNQGIQICGGGWGDVNRGALIGIYGNEMAYPGFIEIQAGAHPTSSIRFWTGATPQARGTIYPSGGLGWGAGAADRGAGTIMLGTAFASGTAFTQLAPGELTIGSPGSGSNVQVFYTSAGVAGFIQTTGGTTQFGTTSDGRLKRDRGPLTGTEVLQRTIVHAFDWIADGTSGRGVFAQEAATVAPFAVSVGTDERDDTGRLTHPWGVDYSKYVPDLIVGWQQHESEIEKLRAEVAALQPAPARLTYGTTDPPPDHRGAAWFSRVRDWLTAWWAPTRPGLINSRAHKGTRYADDTP